ncbi:glycosyltransferase family 2 protein [Desulfoplanes sp.]
MSFCDHPNISIIVSNYCYAQYFDRFFSALLAQEYDLTLVEVIVVDDGSADDSLDKLDVWQTRDRFGAFRIVPIEYLGKPGLVRNVGLNMARGRYFVCIDPDDIPLPQFLPACLRGLETRRQAAVIYSDYVCRTEETENVVCQPDYSVVLLAHQNIVSPPAMFRRHVWEQSDGFRGNTGYEDWDFWVQAAANGFGFPHIPEPLYVYCSHDQGFFSRAKKDDGIAKARIVLNNKGFFEKEVVRWAYGVLRNDAQTPSFQRGIIPGKEELELVRRMVSGNVGHRGVC